MTRVRHAVRLALRIVAVGAALGALGSCTLLDSIVGRGETQPAAQQREPASSAEQTGTPATSEPARTPATGTTWTVVATGTNAAVHIPLARIVTNDALYDDLWAALMANQIDPPSRPPVNFNASTLVAILLGDRSTAGYSVEIVRMEELPKSVSLTLRVNVPATGSMQAQLITSPYLLATIPFVGKNVIFAGDDLETGYIGD